MLPSNLLEDNVGPVFCRFLTALSIVSDSFSVSNSSSRLFSGGRALSGNGLDARTHCDNGDLRRVPEDNIPSDADCEGPWSFRCSVRLGLGAGERASEDRAIASSMRVRFCLLAILFTAAAATAFSLSCCAALACSGATVVVAGLPRA